MKTIPKKFQWLEDLSRYDRLGSEGDPVKTDLYIQINGHISKYIQDQVEKKQIRMIERLMKKGLIEKADKEKV